MSAFALEDGVVYHTYSTYARGVDGLWGMYQWLEREPNARNETALVAPPREPGNWDQRSALLLEFDEDDRGTSRKPF